MDLPAVDDITKALTTLAATQNLRSQAFEGCATCIRECADEGPEGLYGWTAEEIEVHFASCSLVFAHGVLSYPFVDTKVSLCVRDERGIYFRGVRPIGYYRLITLLDGTTDDDYFVIDTWKPTPESGNN